METTDTVPKKDFSILLTEEEKVRIANHPIAILIMIAIPLFSWLTAEKMIDTVNPSDNFSLVGITSYWANLTLTTLFLVIFGGFTFIASIENAIDIGTAVFNIGKHIKFFVKLLWDVGQTIMTYYFVWKFGPELGAMSLIISMIWFGLTEWAESWMFKTNIVGSMKMLVTKTYTVPITGLVTLVLTAITLMSAISAFTRWHVVYGQDIEPTSQEYKFPDQIINFEIRKSGSGRMATATKTERYLCKVKLIFKNSPPKFYAIVSDEQIFSKEALELVLSRPLYVCKKKKSAHQSFSEGMALILSFEDKIPEAEPIDFFEE